MAYWVVCRWLIQFCAIFYLQNNDLCKFPLFWTDSIPSPCSQICISWHYKPELLVLLTVRYNGKWKLQLEPYPPEWLHWQWSKRLSQSQGSNLGEYGQMHNKDLIRNKGCIARGKYQEQGQIITLRVPAPETYFCNKTPQMIILPQLSKVQQTEYMYDFAL